MDELRRPYHDRIAALRQQTVEIVRDASAAVGNVAAARLDDTPVPGQSVLAGAPRTPSRVADVEATVLELLALQAPVARDLRIIMAALRIAQIGDLCLGLGQTLAGRAGRPAAALTPELRDLDSRITAEAVRLLEQAGAAWAVLDEGLARAVRGSAPAGRALQRRYLAGVFRLHDVAVDVAVDLGMGVRAYARITDHALEIADQVLFAATGEHVHVLEEA